MALSGWSWHRLSHEFVVETSSEGLAGAGGSASKKAQLHGCWPVASVLHRVDLYTGRQESPYSMSACF